MPSLSTILAGLLAATAIVAGLALWRLDAALTREAAVRASLDTAVKANATNQATIDRLEGDLVIAQAEAIADAGARRKQEMEADELEKAYLAAKGGPCAGLDALIEQRRLQRQGGGSGANP